eukprot:gene10979-1993_t
MVVLNSLDAGSSSIRLSVLHDSFEVADDGCGITPDDILLCGEAACTSALGDQFSYGCHGRTLYNLAQLVAVAGALVNYSPGLFDSLPGAYCGGVVPSGRAGQLRTWLEAISIAFPAISISFVVPSSPSARAEAVLFHKPSVHSVRNALSLVWGALSAQRMLLLDSVTDGFHIQGYTGHELLSSSDRQHVFLSRWHVPRGDIHELISSLLTLQDALPALSVPTASPASPRTSRRRPARGCLRYRAFVLFITCDPSEVIVAPDYGCPIPVLSDNMSKLLPSAMTSALESAVQ